MKYLKYIKFRREIVSIPENVTFCLITRSENPKYPFYVNMSFQGFTRNEKYKTFEKAQNRLYELMDMVKNKKIEKK